MSCTSALSTPWLAEPFFLLSALLSNSPQQTPEDRKQTSQQMSTSINGRDLLIFLFLLFIPSPLRFRFCFSPFLLGLPKQLLCQLFIAMPLSRVFKAITSVPLRPRYHLQLAVSDATLKKGCYIHQNGPPVVFDIPQLYQTSSFEAEFYAGRKAITDLAQSDSFFLLLCDSMSICHAFRQRTSKNAFVNDRLQQLFHWCYDQNVFVQPWWIPGRFNPADGPTRDKPPGPWAAGWSRLK